MRSRMKGGLLALAMMVFGAGGVSASECASYISGGPGSPAAGELISSATMRQEISGGVRSPIASVEGGFSLEFEVGLYKMSDGTYIVVNCFTYRKM